MSLLWGTRVTGNHVIEQQKQCQEQVASGRFSVPPEDYGTDGTVPPCSGVNCTNGGKQGKVHEKGETSKSKSSKSKPSYREQCPCFSEEDLDSSLKFIAGADTCRYVEEFFEQNTNLYVIAQYLSDDNIFTEHSLGAYDIDRVAVKSLVAANC